ncbi:MAG: D-glycero-beta-D-manno-heptose 1,7-bisphosphate 7-phosphatase [Candidatus Heimdallarchaeota archaeon]|nr:D-glycero-beta-D-manno-heptose 1,7-bisphosphate 7-phosphatase [Candidatus Heimdallarchaeota archaeon]
MIKTKGLFLDRDGIVNEDRCYVYQIKDFHFIEGIFELCREAIKQDYKIVIATNQAGIGRGYYTEEDFHYLTRWMRSKMSSRGVKLEGVYYCPHHPIHGIGDYRRDCENRKPRPGMLLRASSELNIDLEKSVIIGDKLSDLQAGRAAGIKTKVLLSSDPKEKNELNDAHIFNSLSEVLTWFRARS